MIDAIVYLGVKFKFGYKLIIYNSIRSRKFLACVCNVQRNKIVGYRDVFANILVKQCLSILEYGIDSVDLDSNIFKFIIKAWNTASKWLFNYGKFDYTRLFYEHNVMSMRFLTDSKLLCFISSFRSKQSPNISISSKMILRLLSKDLIFCGTFNAKLNKYKLTWFHDVRSIIYAIYKGFVNYCNEMLA